MQCQFCKMSLIDHDELQLHQVTTCPAIKDKDFDGPELATVTFVWINNLPTSNTHDKSHIILSNIEDSIQLNYRNNSSFTSKDIQIFTGNYTGQIVTMDSLIPIPSFNISLTSQCVTISTSILSGNETRMEVVVSSGSQSNDNSGSISDEDTCENVFNENNSICIRSSSSSCSNTNVIEGTTRHMNYALNPEVALNKKIKACDRPSYSIKLNNGSATVTLNTFCFELLRSNLINFLNHSSQYKFYLFPKTDTNGSTPEDVIKVVKVDEMKTEIAMYTINMYRTTSRLMINGPHYDHFIENDLCFVTDKIDSVENHVIELSNKEIKENLLKIKENNSDPHKTTNDHTKVNENTISSVRRVHKTNVECQKKSLAVKRYNTRSSRGSVTSLSAPSYPLESTNLHSYNSSFVNESTVSSSSNDRITGGDTLQTHCDEMEITSQFDFPSDYGEKVSVCHNNTEQIHRIDDILIDKPILYSTPGIATENQLGSICEMESTSQVDTEKPLPTTQESPSPSIIKDDACLADITAMGEPTILCLPIIDYPEISVTENTEYLKCNDIMDSDVEGGESLQLLTCPEANLSTDNSRPKRSSKPPPKFQDHILAKSQMNRKQNSQAPLNERKVDDCIPESGVLYCTCKQPWHEKDGDNMVFCENCTQWLHYSCIGVNKEKAQEVERFICLPCAMSLFDRSENSAEDQSLITSQRHTIEGLTVEIRELSAKVVTLESNLAVEKKRADSLTKDNRKLMNKNGNSESLQSKNLQLKQEVNTLNEHQETLRRTIKSFEGTEEAVSNLKLQLESKEKELNSATTSQEILTKRCSSLEKMKIANENKIGLMEDSSKAELEKTEELQNQVSLLQKEVASHVSINKDLISQTSSPKSVSQDKPGKCNECKRKADEIKTLKERIVVTESTIKDNEKSALSLRREVYAAKMEVKREKAINNLLMKYNDPDDETVDPITTVSEELTVNTSKTSVSTSTDDTATGVDGDPCQGDGIGNDAQATDAKNSDRDSEVVSRKDCRFEVQKRGSCPYPKCKFNHNISNNDGSNDDYCEIEFDGGTCSDQETCGKIHDFDQSKVSNGPCVHELRRKNSCQHNDCHYSHQIPSSRRGDAQLIAQTVQKMKTKKRSQKASEKTVKDVCATEFFGGKKSCTAKNCMIDKDHILDFTKIQRGICFFEFYKKDSCSRKSKCHFSHKFPLQCLSDPSVIQNVLNSVNRFSNKAKVVEVLGQEVVDAALKCQPPKQRSVVDQYDHTTNRGNDTKGEGVRGHDARNTTGDQHHQSSINNNKPTVTSGSVPSTIHSGSPGISTMNINAQSFQQKSNPSQFSISGNTSTKPVYTYASHLNKYMGCDEEPPQPALYHQSLNQHNLQHNTYQFLSPSEANIPPTSSTPSMMPNYGSDYPNVPYNKSVNTNQLPPSNTTPSPYSFLADIVKELISKESQKLQLQPYVV